MAEIEKVNIRPGVSILSVLKHLNYKPWYALAEFVDNSIESYLNSKKEIQDVEGENTHLTVSISLEKQSRKIIVKDNAAGIRYEDYERAFRAAEVPPDGSKLSEFGMGMKSAACWFANRWKVRTTALGENVERSISFDITKIVHDKLDELQITSRKVPPDDHWTIIELYDSPKFPVKRSLSKVKDHLRSIYREYTRNGTLNLWFGDESLIYDTPKILVAPFFKDELAEKLEWRKEIDFEFGNGHTAKGFAAIRETASTSQAGFALFRHGRVIEGSADEGFRPEYIFGKSNSYRYQRLFGEIHLEGFDVSHTKDGFQWDELLEPFLLKLYEQLSDPDLNLLKQAEGYRKRPKKKDFQNIASEVVDRTSNSLEGGIGEDLSEVRNDEPKKDEAVALPKRADSYFRKIHVSMEDGDWMIHLELSYDRSMEDLYEIGDQFITDPSNGIDIREVGIRLSLMHPFMTRFAGTDKEKIEPVLRIIAGLGLSEAAAIEAGVKQSGTVRRKLNKLINRSLSKP